MIDRARRLLVSPDFGRLWAAAAVSSFGSYVTRLALPLAAILVLGVWVSRPFMGVLTQAASILGTGGAP